MKKGNDNLIAKEDIGRAVAAIQRIKHMDLDGINPHDLLTAIEALDRQYPQAAIMKHKPGEEAALIECNSCGWRLIANYELYKTEHPTWYCKQCGQLCAMPDEKDGVEND